MADSCITNPRKTITHPQKRSLLRKLRFTPMRDILRGRLSARLDINDLLDASSLPEPICGLIFQVVRRTRLWRAEKVDVTHELIAHFHDGLAAGATMSELLQNFGDVKQAAKLIRRAKKRNRPLAWHALRYATFCIAGLIGTYVLTAVMLLTQKPNPKVDYLAVINAPAKAVPEEDRAWPLYRQFLLDGGSEMIESFRLKQSPLQVKTDNSRFPPLIRHGEPGWPEAAAYLQQHRDLLDQLRHATSKPSLGFVIQRHRSQYSLLDQKALYPTEQPVLPKAIDIPTEQSERAELLLHDSLLGVHAPYLGMMLQFERLLRADTELAWAQGDLSRVLANDQAVQGMAKHISQPHIGWVEYMFQQRILRDEYIHLLDLMSRNMNQWSTAQLEAMLRQLTLDKELLRIHSRMTDAFTQDRLQRIYSDRGYVTMHGLKMIDKELSAQTKNSYLLLPYVQDMFRTATLPVTVYKRATRDDVDAKLDQIHDLQDQYLLKPAWERWGANASPSPLHVMLASWDAETRYKYGLLLKLAPFVSSFVEHSDLTLAYHDTCHVVIALELYRREQGQLPASLEALTPRYLREVPTDLSTGQPLRMKVREDGRFILYGLGKDGVDDGGQLSETGRKRWPWPVEDGDWVLYPPVVNPALVPATQPAQDAE